MDAINMRYQTKIKGFWWSSFPIIPVNPHRKTIPWSKSTAFTLELNYLRFFQSAIEFLH
jgi:hypothetical protein